MDIRQIKLIMLDLDETLWKGTLSEGDLEVKEPIAEFLHNTLDIGIIHSICPKNDLQQAEEKLSKLGLWDMFVFPSIDWTPKGVRVKATIEAMGLRPGNVLFVDDNVQNLEEVKYYAGEV